MLGRKLSLDQYCKLFPRMLSIFLLLKSITSKLNSLCSKFWWGFNGDHSKVHWMNWGNMGLSKQQGGLGFRCFHNFNLALLSKQVLKNYSGAFFIN